MSRIRPNYFNAQNVTQKDLEDEQDYFIGKIDDIIKDFHGKGVLYSRYTSLEQPKTRALKIVADPLSANYFDLNVANQTSFSIVNRHRGNDPFELAMKFKAQANNIQAVEALVSVDTLSFRGFLDVEIRELLDPTDVDSDPSGRTLATAKVASNSLTDEHLVTNGGSVLFINFASNLGIGDAPNRTGIVTEPGNLEVGKYYAIVFRRTDFTGISEDGEALVPSNTNIYIHGTTSGAYADGFISRYNPILNVWTNSPTREENIFFRIYAATLALNPGVGFVQGKRIEVPELVEDINIITTFDKRCSDYVCLKYRDTYEEFEVQERSDVPVATRIRENYEIHVLSEMQFLALDETERAERLCIARVQFDPDEVITSDDVMIITDLRVPIPFTITESQRSVLLGHTAYFENLFVGNNFSASFDAADSVFIPSATKVGLQLDNGVIPILPDRSDDRFVYEVQIFNVRDLAQRYYIRKIEVNEDGSAGLELYALGGDIYLNPVLYLDLTAEEIVDGREIYVLESNDIGALYPYESPAIVGRIVLDWSTLFNNEQFQDQTVLFEPEATEFKMECVHYCSP